MRLSTLVDTTLKVFKIDENFSCWTNNGFIAVKKKNFKNDKEKAYQYMQELIEKYKKVENITLN